MNEIWNSIEIELLTDVCFESWPSNPFITAVIFERGLGHQFNMFFGESTTTAMQTVDRPFSIASLFFNAVG